MRFLPSSWGVATIVLFNGRAPVEATLYVGADVSRSCATYFAKFGRTIEDPQGSIVKAQDLKSNPWLCTNNFDSFHSHSLSGDHLALVASEGNCTLQQKIMMTESLAVLNPAINMLIITGTSPLLPKDLDDMILQTKPKHCQDPDDIGCSFRTNLTVISITKACGDHLLDYIHQQSEFTMADGGPALFVLDAEPQASDNSVILKTTIVLMMLFIISLVIVHRLFGPSPGLAEASRQVQPALLTVECVECFHCPNAAKELIDNTRDGDPPSCAVCIESIELNSKVTVLPCGHHFHHECILPWLTERQATCPLCKYSLQPLKLDEPLSRESQQRGLGRQLFCQQWSRLVRTVGLDQHRRNVELEASETHDYGELELAVEPS